MGFELPAEWSLRALAECGAWLSGGTPSKTNAAYWGGHIPWVGPKDLHTPYVYSAEESLTTLGAENGTRTVPEETVLVVVRSMALANGLQIGFTRRQVAFNQDIKAIRPASDVDPRYLFYALWGCHDALHGLVDEASHGTKRLRTELLGAFRIPLPPEPEQERIVDVVGALDDKIDSNRRLAAVLEWVTQTEFRARLVDPLETLWKGQAGPSSSDSERGSLVDVADFVNGKAFTKEANGRGRPILRIRELKGGVRDDTPRSDIDVPAQHIAHDGDILFAWSGSLGVYRWSGPEALINQHIFKVLSKRPYTDWFVYEWIREHMPRFQDIARDKATTMGHIQRHHLAEAVVSVPPPTALDAARSLLDPIDRQRLLLGREDKALAALRDTLLPKLVSGQIRVPDTADPEEVTGPVAEEVAA